MVRCAFRTTPPSPSTLPPDLSPRPRAATSTRRFYPTELWFNSDTGAITGGDDSSLAQPAECNPDLAQCIVQHPGHPELCPLYVNADRHITQSPIQREYDFNIYLPKNPSDVFAEVGQVRPRAPLYLNISNPHASDGPEPHGHAHQ